MQSKENKYTDLIYELRSSDRLFESRVFMFNMEKTIKTYEQVFIRLCRTSELVIDSIQKVEIGRFNIV